MIYNQPTQRWARMALATVVLASFHLSSPAQETSDSLTRRVLSEYGIRFSEGNSVKLLKSGQEKFDDMFEAIRQARHSVHLEYFNFRNDSIAWLLLNLLREKRREGVEVRALFDGFGNDSNNQPLKKEHITSLRNDSVDIWEFDPIRFPWVNHIWPRDHRKIVVIDGHTAYTGGMNVADYYIKGTEQVGEWRDMHCRIVGPAVTELQHIFMRIWKRTTGEEVTGRQYFWPGVIAEDQTPGRNKTVGIVNREPGTKRLADGGLLGKHNAARRLYVTAIDNAQDSIRIINPYFMPVPSVMKALKRAIKRGVKVVIMVSAKSDIPLTPDAVFYNVHRLMKRGATVWVYQPGFHHSKIMMVDGRFCTVGSTNLDARSLRFDYEENALILNQETTRELDDMFNRDIEKSVLMTPETWNQMRTRWQKFRGWFGHLLGPWM